MPQVIDYPLALARLQAAGLRCNYFNSGSFGLPDSPETPREVRGWIGPPDPTIRAENRKVIRHVPEPFEPTLARWAVRAWQSIFPGPAWLMPASHWSFELTHGNSQWLPSLLASEGVDASLLKERTDASPVEFAMQETAAFAKLAEGLLLRLTASDFNLAFPTYPAVCMLHHHKQLWWSSTSRTIAAALDRIE